MTIKASNSKFADMSLISERDFLDIGVGRVGYIKPIMKGELSGFGAYAANGHEIGLFATESEAIHALWALEMDNVTRH